MSPFALLSYCKPTTSQYKLPTYVYYFQTLLNTDLDQFLAFSFGQQPLLPWFVLYTSFAGLSLVPAIVTLQKVTIPHNQDLSIFLIRKIELFKFSSFLQLQHENSWLFLHPLVFKHPFLRTLLPELRTVFPDSSHQRHVKRFHTPLLSSPLFCLYVQRLYLPLRHSITQGSQVQLLVHYNFQSLSSQNLSRWIPLL